jgi:hypothetical protein
VDEPRLIGKSWKGLLLANARLYRLILLPLAILTVVMMPVWFALDALYGSTLLPTGKSAIVTLGFNRPLEQISPIPQLKAPEGISVESPATRVFSQQQVSWRVRPLHTLAAQLQWAMDGKYLGKTIAAGEGLRIHSRRRTRSLVELVRYPVEARLPEGFVDWIEIDYPAADVKLLGIELHWSIWFIAFSLLGAILSPAK